MKEIPLSSDEVLILKKSGNSEVRVNKPKSLSFTQESRLLEAYVWAPFEMTSRESDDVRLNVFSDFMQDLGAKNPYQASEESDADYIKTLAEIFSGLITKTRETIDSPAFKEMDEWISRWNENWETQKKIAELEFTVQKAKEPKPSFFNLNARERENFDRQIRISQSSYDEIVSRKPFLQMPSKHFAPLLEFNVFYSLRQEMIYAIQDGMSRMGAFDDFCKAVEGIEFYGWKYWYAPSGLRRF